MPNRPWGGVRTARARRGRRPSGWLAVVTGVVAVALLAGGQARLAHAHPYTSTGVRHGAGPGGAGGTVSASTVCATALADLAAVWDPGRTGVGGYGRIQSFAQPASLYETSWSLRLAAALHVGIAPVHKSQVLPWLRAILADPEAASPATDGLSPMTTQLLAVRALATLGEPIPSAQVGSDLARLQVGSGYRMAPGAPVSTAARYVASEIAALARVSLPTAVIDAIRSTWPTGLAARTPDEIIDQGVPGVGAALRLGLVSGLPAQTRVRAAVRRWQAAVLAAGSSGVGLGVLASLRDMGAGVGLHLTSGYLSLSPRGIDGEPHVTVNALAAGATLPAAAVGTLRIGALPQGWVLPPAQPSVAVTRRAVAVEGLCGTPVAHRGSLRTLVARWVHQAPDVTGQSPYRWVDIVRLARQLGVPVPTTLATGLAASAGRAAAASVGAGTAMAGTTMAGTTMATAAAWTVIAGTLPATAPGVLLRKSFTGASMTVASGLVSVYGFTARRGSATPDLLSTVTGAVLVGAGRAPMASWPSGYVTAWGPAWALADTPGLAFPDVTSLSLLAGVQLVTGHPEPVVGPTS